MLFRKVAEAAEDHQYQYLINDMSIYFFVQFLYLCTQGGRIEKKSAPMIYGNCQRVTFQEIRM